MIRLDETTYVAASEVASVESFGLNQYTLVTMKSGKTFGVKPYYGLTVWQTTQEILNRIEQELKP